MFCIGSFVGRSVEGSARSIEKKYSTAIEKVAKLTRTHIQNHERRSVVYVATHDCDTALGWWHTLPRRIKRASGLAGVEPNWELIELALSSRADLAIMQAQDVLGLGSEARMNMPGTSKGNWVWQLRPGQLTTKHAKRLRTLTAASGRLPS